MAHQNIILRFIILSVSLIITFSNPLWAQDEENRTNNTPLKSISIDNNQQYSLESEEGILKYHWTQSYPYNMLCPRDPLNGYSYSFAGCSAVAMAQIIAHLKVTNSTRFDDNDDYYHNFYGRCYDIDDDWSEIGFPSFPELNRWMDSLDFAFAHDRILDDTLAAALIFACGTALQQVYTYQNSGTFGVDQAYNAYQQFGFSQCKLYRTTDSTMYATLIDNLEHGYPAHLALETPAGDAGHNLVVDGYRESDDKFHLNFGYGGMYDGWYSIPDSNIYYNLSQLEGIIVDIIPQQTDIKTYPSEKQLLNIYPNPVENVIHIHQSSDNVENADYKIFNSIGQMVQHGKVAETITLNNLKQGLYILKMGTKTCKFIVK